MQIVIDIREDFLYEIKHKHPNMRTELEQSVLDGTILPKGHGDLIDRSKLLTVTDYDGENERTYVLYEEIDNAHVIIEADKSESEVCE